MARKLRVEYPGTIYHITHRGNRKMRIFSDDHDRERFLLRLAESVDTYNVRLYMRKVKEDSEELKNQLAEISGRLELLQEKS